MKINGKKIEGPNIEIVVVSRLDGDIEFKCQSVIDFDDFEKLDPEPVVPWVRTPTQPARQNPEDPSYKKDLTEWQQRRFDWLCLESLKATPNIEWETVKADKPHSWKNWRDELKQSGLTPLEIGRILQAVLKANSVDEDKIDEARKRFLAGRLPAVTE